MHQQLRTLASVVTQHASWEVSSKVINHAAIRSVSGTHWALYTAPIH